MGFGCLFHLLRALLIAGTGRDLQEREKPVALIEGTSAFRLFHNGTCILIPNSAENAGALFITPIAAIR